MDYQKRMESFTYWVSRMKIVIPIKVWFYKTKKIRGRTKKMKREKLRSVNEMIDNPKDLPKGKEVVIFKLKDRKGVRVVNPDVARDNRKKSGRMKNE